MLDALPRAAFSMLAGSGALPLRNPGVQFAFLVGTALY